MTHPTGIVGISLATALSNYQEAGTITPKSGVYVAGRAYTTASLDAAIAEYLETGTITNSKLRHLEPRLAELLSSEADEVVRGRAA